MRLAFVVGASAGGMGAHVAMLADGCAAAGMTVSVFAPEATGVRLFRPGSSAFPPGPDEGASLAAEAARPGGGGSGWSGGFTQVEIGDRPRPAGDVAAVLALRRELRRCGPDVVHAHGLRAGALTALALAGRDRPPLAVTVHNAPSAGAAGRVYGVLEWVVARRADAVTWVSADLGERLRRAGARDAGRALVPAPPAPAPSPAETAAVRAELRAGDRPVVLAAGRLTRQKGFGTLIAAAAEWRDRRPVPLLVIAGDGPLAP